MYLYKNVKINRLYEEYITRKGLLTISVFCQILCKIFDIIKKCVQVCTNLSVLSVFTYTCLYLYVKIYLYMPQFFKFGDVQMLFFQEIDAKLQSTGSRRIIRLTIMALFQINR